MSMSYDKAGTSAPDLKRLVPCLLAPPALQQTHRLSQQQQGILLAERKYLWVKR